MCVCCPPVKPFLFSVALICRKCYYLVCFKESDSWSMVFDIGGSRKIAAIGLKVWGVEVES